MKKIKNGDILKQTEYLYYPDIVHIAINSDSCFCIIYNVNTFVSPRTS